MPSTHDSPLVSVILPVYNAGRYLSSAIESILSQTYRYFELIIIDDGSTDDSLSIIQQYASTDDRIDFVSRANQGLSFSLNQALSMSHGHYIARMDADDISFPDRLEKQVAYLELNHDVHILSAAYIPFDDSNHYEPIKHPQSSSFIKLLLTCCCPICHPAVMFRRSVLNDLVYLPLPNEDHLLWTRLATHYNFANLTNPLLYYRLSKSSLSRTNMISIFFYTKYYGFRYFMHDYIFISKISFDDFNRLHPYFPLLPWKQAWLYLFASKFISFLRSIKFN